ncbi:hypothetical protein G7046_g2600 [Stylonectria norvegica]|nr:hypothetical protein G7046_g2600 [Stylonectria norvegica]
MVPSTLCYHPSIKYMDYLPVMDSREFDDTCNKSVPFYILGAPHWYMVGQVLHNYIYRRWFQPYRTDIEFDRFICKFISPKDIPNEPSLPHSKVENLVDLNKAICASVERHRAIIEEQVATGESTFDSPIIFKTVDLKQFVLQPLFRALLVVADCSEYGGEDSQTVGRMPVLLVRTGIEEGLSAPITFESLAVKTDGQAWGTISTVKTTLEAAIDFVISLEAREAAVFGLQPDPATAWHRDTVYCSAEEREILGDKILDGPSSRFVDTEKYTEWSGAGEQQDSFVLADWELTWLRHGEAMKAERLAIEAVLFIDWLPDMLESTPGDADKGTGHLSRHVNQQRLRRSDSYRCSLGTKKLWIKGLSFSIVNLTVDTPLITQLQDGTVASFRLSPQDYHRHHSSVAGRRKRGQIHSLLEWQDFLSRLFDMEQEAEARVPRP